MTSCNVTTYLSSRHLDFFGIRKVGVPVVLQPLSTINGIPSSHLARIVTKL